MLCNSVMLLTLCKYMEELSSLVFFNISIKGHTSHIDIFSNDPDSTTCIMYKSFYIERSQDTRTGLLVISNDELQTQLKHKLCPDQSEILFLGDSLCINSTTLHHKPYYSVRLPPIPLVNSSIYPIYHMSTSIFLQLILYTALTETVVNISSSQTALLCSARGEFLTVLISHEEEHHIRDVWPSCCVTFKFMRCFLPRLEESILNNTTSKICMTIYPTTIVIQLCDDGITSIPSDPIFLLQPIRDM